MAQLIEGGALFRGLHYAKVVLLIWCFKTCSTRSQFVGKVKRTRRGKCELVSFRRGLCEIVSSMGGKKFKRRGFLAKLAELPFRLTWERVGQL
ncbi:MAG: hypothetical protein ACTS4X_01775 [Candidatus Hodgkinia cicadicola]